MSEEAGLRRITIPIDVLRKAIDGSVPGVALEFAVTVNWPELRLTEEQAIANTVARASGHEEPYPDHSIFAIVLPILAPVEAK